MNSFNQQFNWKSARCYFRTAIPDYLRSPLLCASSSTQWLRSASCDTLKVRILKQMYAKLLRDEAAILKLKQQNVALVREVKIEAFDAPWMLARAVFPIKTLQGKTKAVFTNLDERPLGSLLFQEPSLQRSEFELAQVNLPEYSVLGAAANEKLWARRSIFFIHEKPIVLTEIFLPALIQHLKNQ